MMFPGDMPEERERQERIRARARREIADAIAMAVPELYDPLDELARAVADALMAGSIPHVRVTI